MKTALEDSKTSEETTENLKNENYFILLWHHPAKWNRCSKFLFWKKPSHHKVSYGLLGSDAGIVTDDDLVMDIWRGLPRPYDPIGGMGGYNYWQCFNLKDVKVEHRKWRDKNPMTSPEIMDTMCMLDIVAIKDGKMHSYGERRAHSDIHCVEFMKSWKKLTFGESQVCLNAEWGHIEISDKAYKKLGFSTYQSWTWDKFKTRKGCYSYFKDYCKIEYWRDDPNIKKK